MRGLNRDMPNKCMLHQPLRGLDGFPLVPRYKTAANAGVSPSDC
jgi:hypothetical protein